MNPISTVVIVVVVMLMMRFFAKQSKKAPSVDMSGYTVLKLPVLYEIIGWVGAVMIVFLTVAIFLFSAKSADGNNDFMGAIFGIIVFGFFFFMCVLLILSRRKSFIRFNDEKIEVHGIFAKTRVLYWRDVKNVTFTGKRTLKLSDDKVKVGVSYSLIGFQSFVEKMKEKVASAVIGDTNDKIEKMYQHFGVQ